MKSRILLMILACYSCSLNAQSLYEVSLNEKTANASLIIEGKVIEQNSFWNASHSVIYTSNKVEVYKIFKGTASADTLEVLTVGGTVGNTGLRVSELLTLNPGQVGTFFLFPNKNNIRSPKTLQRLWEVYGSAQGFINYDLHTETASAPFVRYKSISAGLYQELELKTSRAFENRKPAFSVNAISHSNSRVLTPLAPSITNFSPAIVNAGSLLDAANNVLTINGSGFGVGSGSAAVLFDNADDGSGGTPFSVAANDPLVILWSDTQIKIKVPTEAGTGALQVMDAGGLTTTAATNLEVLYSILDYNGKETTLINANGSGGYTISYSTNTSGGAINFDTDPAKQTFQRALTTWKENAGANIIEGGTTAVQAVAFDGICTIMFDNSNTGVPLLASGVLAVCYSWFTTCPSGPAVNQGQKVEFEVIIRNAGVSSGSATFTNGPCPPNSINFSDLDLETVILHELGHALNLGHIIDNYQGVSIGKINPNKLMHYAIPNSLRRNTPDFSAKSAALYAITPQGAITGACNVNGEMTPLTAISEPRDDCPATFPVTPTPPGTVINFDLVHAGSNRYIDPAYTQIRCGSSNGASITNNAYYVFRTSAAGTLAMTVSGYTTTPAAIAACTQLNPSIPVTGIRVVIYQVNSCPAAGSFPVPFACSTITGNGALAPIVGLAANSNYLVYLEGIENTKATFSLSMGGTALPIKFESFTGTIVNASNRLDWVIDYSLNVKDLILQKSSNGVEYVDIDSTDGSLLLPATFYNDTKPYAGKNFYRLAVINNDGTVQYSNIVLLVRNDQFVAGIYPNPSSSTINVEINTVRNGRYHFELYSSTGQLVRREDYEINTQRQLLHIPVANLANGSYFLKISNDKNETVQNSGVTVNH